MQALDLTTQRVRQRLDDGAIWYAEKFVEL
nr:MAG TPA: hypothetical protein [Caudoviricetes sp.]